MSDKYGTELTPEEQQELYEDMEQCSEDMLEDASETYLDEVEDYNDWLGPR